jgi:DinB superfamily
MATREQVNELLEKMSVRRESLIAQVASLDDAVASRVPVDKIGEEQWTVKEQLAHLCEMEISYDGWVQSALREHNPTIGGWTPVPAKIPVESANVHSVPELLSALREERQKTVALIQGMSLDSFERTATHPNFGTLTVMQWLRSFYRHDRMHADQVAGRDPEYKPKFTGREPDQRTARMTGGNR